LAILRGVLAAAPKVRRIAAGYGAKSVCSALFVSKRALADVMAQDLQGIPGLTVEVDQTERRVRARAGGCERTAVFHEGLGSVLLEGDESLPFPTLPPCTPRPHAGEPWPAGEAVEQADFPRLDAVLDEAFSEPDPKRPRRTRAIVVVFRGRIVAERYAPGLGADTPLLGWSMSKSVVNALIGTLVASGALDVHQPVPVPEWANGDPRARLTYDVLLRMSSGLRFWEQYWNPLSHVTSMLFHHPGAAAYAASFPLVAEPDTRWSYASGTTNLLTRALRLGRDHADYLALPRAFFDRIGMHSALMEIDASGHFLGSSFSYATARDWARFGQLYLQDGLWNGERVLPEGWVDYTRRPTPAAPCGEYGAHFWLNAGAKRKPLCPRLPHDAFFARGHEEQSVSVIPSREAVVVRLGQTADHSAWSLEDFLADVLDALPQR
jgi:CubicO group peptidase (beta-lactamase class C family)